MTPRSEKEYPIGIPLCEKGSVSPLLSRDNIDELKVEARRTGYSLRAYISMILRKYACQNPKGSQF